MKKWLSLFIALLIALMPVSAPAEPAAALDAPAEGAVVNGFELIESRPFDMIGAQVHHFVHQRTGAELFYIENDDTNRVFDLTFRTQAIDNTGLPHVFEHATLDGSGKYPSKELWFNLSNGSYNTFMNAMTAQTYTTYPVASLSEAQLLKYADLYTDCCFNPMIMEDESIYREEAWRYRMGSLEEPLTLEGTVYSEMLGAHTLQQRALYDNRRTAMPGSYYGNVSGGDPVYIPDMTYDMLRSYHDRYYHPSNCVAVLYGQLDNYAAFLALLDEAFAPYERREIALEDPGYTPITGPVEATFTFPAEAGASTQHASTMVYSIILPGLKDDPDRLLQMEMLGSLLASDTSPLSQTLRRAMPTAQFGMGLQQDGPEAYMIFLASSVDPEEADVFRRTVDAALAEIAENGFAQDMVDSEMAWLEVASRLVRESSSIGVNIAPEFVAQYLETGVPFRYIDSQEALANIDQWNREGVFSGLAAQWLTGSELTAFTITSPEPGARERRDAELQAHLAEVKAGMSEDALQAIVDASNAVDAPNPDTEGMLRALTAVTVDSLPEEYKTYDVQDETDAAGVRHIDATAGVDGIGNVSLFIDAQGLAQEDIHWFHLFVTMIGELDTERHTREELDILIDRYLYNIETRLSMAREGDGYHPRMRLGWIALDDDQAAAYDLMYEIVYETKFDDVQRVLENIRSYAASMKSGINSTPYNTLLTRGLAASSESMRYTDWFNGLEYYRFLTEAEALFQEDPETGIEKLRSIQRAMDNSTGAIAAFAGNADSIALNRPLADAFMARLDARPVEPVRYALPAPESSEALIVDQAVQYNLVCASYEQLGLEGYSADMDALTTLVNDMFLLPLLRDQYGAYGVMHGAMVDEGVYILSYRDPNIAETFDVYEQLADRLAAAEIDQATLDGYILSAYTGYALSEGELSGAQSAINYAIEGRSQDEILDYMRALKAATPESIAAYAEMYRSLMEHGYRATAGGAAAINAQDGRYLAVLDPFGSAARTQASLADVPIGSEHFEAVRYAYDNGLMGALEDGSFGAEVPATVGDIALAVGALAGMTGMSAQETVDALGQYGILWEGAQADDALDAESCIAVLTAFASAVGMSEAPDIAVTADPVTRVDLAEALYAFVSAAEQG